MFTKWDESKYFQQSYRSVYKAFSNSYRNRWKYTYKILPQWSNLKSVYRIARKRSVSFNVFCLCTSMLITFKKKLLINRFFLFALFLSDTLEMSGLRKGQRQAGRKKARHHSHQLEKWPKKISKKGKVDVEKPVPFPHSTLDSISLYFRARVSSSHSCGRTLHLRVRVWYHTLE